MNNSERFDIIVSDRQLPAAVHKKTDAKQTKRKGQVIMLVTIEDKVNWIFSQRMNLTDAHKHLQIR